MGTIFSIVGGELAPGVVRPKWQPLAALASDSFGGDAVADINGRVTDNAGGGIARTWVAGAGMAKNATQLTKAVTSASTNAFAGFNVAETNVRVTAFMPTAPSAGALYIDVRKNVAETAGSKITCYRLRVQSDRTLALLHRDNGGTVIGASVAFADGDTVGIDVTGSSISIVVNGEIKQTVVDARITTGGIVELVAGTTSVFALDDLRIYKTFP